MTAARFEAHAVVFDLDGTLVDSRRDIAIAANHALRAHGSAELPESEIAQFVGDGARRLIERASKRARSEAQIDRLLETFLDYYTQHAADTTIPMEGAEATLHALRPLPLAICTNKPRSTTDALLEALGWTRTFNAVVAGGDLPQHKPDPAPLMRIASLLNVAPRRLLMVGDGPQDVECGRALGCATVGIEGGLIPRERLLAARPDVMIDRLDELPGLILA